jgi:hypothetical protein
MGSDFRQVAAGIEIPNPGIRSDAGTFPGAHPAGGGGKPPQIMPKVELHAQQSGEVRPGQVPGRLAVVELEVLFLE